MPCGDEWPRPASGSSRPPRPSRCPRCWPWSTRRPTRCGNWLAGSPPPNRTGRRPPKSDRKSDGKSSRTPPGPEGGRHERPRPVPEAPTPPFGAGRAAHRSRQAHGLAVRQPRRRAAQPGAARPTAVGPPAPLLDGPRRPGRRRRDRRRTVPAPHRDRQAGRPVRPAPGSLDGPYLDLVRDGVPDLGNTYGAQHDRLVYAALVQTAMSASQRGHAYHQWHALLGESVSRLGHQARRAGGRKDRSDPSYHRLLTKAWDEALEVVAERPALCPADRAVLIDAVRRVIADADAALSDDERAVLNAACTLAEQYGTVRPACPRRE